MLKKVFTAALLMLVLAGGAQAARAQEVEEVANPKKVEICHRDNNVKKPYGPKRIEVSINAVDGEGRNDHDHHRGPVATSEAVATELKNNKEMWGDIIPPVSGVTEGLNWTAEGQAIWNNNCQYVKEEEPTPQADISAALVCATIEGQAKIQLTIKNEGDAAGTVTINGVDVEVAVDATVVRTFDSKTPVTVVFGEETLVSKTLDCTPGQGGETPETPVTPVVPKNPVTPASTPAVLPYTSGSMTKVVALGTLGFAGIALLVASSLKKRFLLS